MATFTPPNTPALGSNDICPHCHCNAVSANLGHQLMAHITKLTLAEHTQMLALIARILAESQQQSQPKTINKTKRNKKH
jgi:hypothetical protein